MVLGKALKWRHGLCLEFVWINSLSESCFLSEKENPVCVPRFCSPGSQNNALCRVSARGVSVDELVDKGLCSSILLFYSMILLYEEQNYSLMNEWRNNFLNFFYLMTAISVTSLLRISAKAIIDSFGSSCTQCICFHFVLFAQNFSSAKILPRPIR